MVNWFLLHIWEKVTGKRLAVVKYWRLGTRQQLLCKPRIGLRCVCGFWGMGITYMKNSLKHTCSNQNQNALWMPGYWTVAITAKTFQFLINTLQAIKLAKLIVARNPILDISDSLNCPNGQSWLTFANMNMIMKRWYWSQKLYSFC